MTERGPRLKEYMASTETPSYDGIARAAAEDAVDQQRAVDAPLRVALRAWLDSPGIDTNTETALIEAAKAWLEA